MERPEFVSQYEDETNGLLLEHVYSLYRRNNPLDALDLFSANLNKSLRTPQNNEKSLLFGFSPEEDQGIYPYNYRGEPIYPGMVYHTVVSREKEDLFRNAYNQLLYMSLIKFNYILGYLFVQTRDSRATHQNTKEDKDRMARYLWKTLFPMLNLQLQFRDPKNNSKQPGGGFNGIGIGFFETDIVGLHSFVTPSIETMRQSGPPIIPFVPVVIPELTFIVNPQEGGLKVDLSLTTNLNWKIESVPVGRTIVDSLVQERGYFLGTLEAVEEEMKWVNANIGDEKVPYQQVLSNLEIKAEAKRQMVVYSPKYTFVLY